VKQYMMPFLVLFAFLQAKLFNRVVQEKWSWCIRKKYIS